MNLDEITWLASWLLPLSCHCTSPSSAGFHFVRFIAFWNGTVLQSFIYFIVALEKEKSWGEVKRMARNKTRCQCFVNTLCPLRDNRNWWWWFYCKYIYLYFYAFRGYFVFFFYYWYFPISSSKISVFIENGFWYLWCQYVWCFYQSQLIANVKTVFFCLIVYF